MPPLIRIGPDQHGTHTGPTRVQHGSMLDPCWIHVGSMLGPTWVHVGPMLGPTWVPKGPLWPGVPKGPLWPGTPTKPKMELFQRTLPLKNDLENFLKIQKRSAKKFCTFSLLNRVKIFFLGPISNIFDFKQNGKTSRKMSQNLRPSQCGLGGANAD